MNVMHLKSEIFLLSMYIEIVPVTFTDEELIDVSARQLLSYDIVLTEFPKTPKNIIVSTIESPMQLGYVEYLEVIGGLKCIKFYPYRFFRPKECGRRISDLIQLHVAEDIIEKFQGDIQHSTYSIARIQQLERLQLKNEEWYSSEEYIERIAQGIKRSIYK
jgi:hypothetical protein